MRPVRIGCSGWNYPHWRETVYPKGLSTRQWLAYYSELFDTVEVNTTFYRLPRRESVAAWVAETPPGFLFAVKASRYLTHMKRLTDLGRGVERFYERIEPLVRSPKVGPMLAAAGDLPPERRAPGGGPRGSTHRPALLRVPPRELVRCARLRAPARAQRRPRDRRPPEAAVPDR